MNAFAQLVQEIAALSEEEKCSRGLSNAEFRSLGFTRNLEDHYRILGQVSSDTRAIEVLAWKRFQEANVVLRDYPRTTLAEEAVRSRTRNTLESERKALLNLFRVLVEREVPEATNYSPWELNRAGQVFVLKKAVTNDEKSIDYWSGKTQDSAVNL
jgi:hypothetical protein